LLEKRTEAITVVMRGSSWDKPLLNKPTACVQEIDIDIVT